MSKLLLLPLGAVAAVSAVAIGISTVGSSLAVTLPASPPPAVSSGAASAIPGAPTALTYAYEQLGKPYEWGASGPDSFDCSGLTYAAYEQAGVAIPRTSEQQWLALPHVPFGSMRPGDLVFFNPGEFAAGLPGHVGIYVGDGRMIDAPHTGAVVRVDSVVSFGEYVGAGRPLGPS
jgi:cell wall-associated NlpC family hydrolase